MFFNPTPLVNLGFDIMTLSHKYPDVTLKKSISHSALIEPFKTFRAHDNEGVSL
jgi:hypothetical protein